MCAKSPEARSGSLDSLAAAQSCRTLRAAAQQSGGCPGRAGREFGQQGTSVDFMVGKKVGGVNVFGRFAGALGSRGTEWNHQ
jgi:hypothetical protein